MNFNQKRTAPAATSSKTGRCSLDQNAAVTQLIRQSLAEFRKVTGLAALLVPGCPPPKPVRFGGQENEFCRRVWNSCEGGCVACHQVQRELFRRLDRKLKVHSVCCAGGIIQLAVPVIVQGKHVATVLGGKVRLQPATDAQFKALAARLGLLGTPGELRELRGAYFRSPLLAPPKLRAASRLLDALARLFGEAIARCPARPGPADESPHVTQAKAYVQAHLGERVTTRQVAQILNLSNSYFCRSFRRSTGMTFHAYLAQARVEAAKTRLLNTPFPITEICYVSGFQSVSDFNRVFKAKVGTSPSQFRREAGQP